MQASSLEDFRAKLKTCHELQETYSIIAHKIAEDFLAGYLLNYLTKPENFQKMIDRLIIHWRETFQQKEIHDEEIFVMLDNYLQKWSKAIHKLKSILSVYAPNRDNEFKIQAHLSINVDWPSYDFHYITVKGLKNCEGVVSIMNLEEAFPHNAVEDFRHAVIKAVLTFARITQLKLTSSIVMYEDYDFWLHQNIKYDLSIRFAIEKVEASKPQRVPIVAAFLAAVIGLLCDTKIRKLKFNQHLYTKNDPLTLDLRFIILTSFYTLRKRFPIIQFDSDAA